MSMLVIAGLGNPGLEYRKTRHNIGFMLLDDLAEKCGVSWRYDKRFNADIAATVITGKNCLLVKPQTFMNASGQALGAIKRYYKLNDAQFVVAFDEFQVALGNVKVSLRGGDGGHNGVKDLLHLLGSRFIRYRLGIGPEEAMKSGIKNFVLGKFTPTELVRLDEVFPRLIYGLEMLIEVGPTQAMNLINQKKFTNESDSNKKI